MKCLILVNESLPSYTSFDTLLKLILAYGGTIEGTCDRGRIELFTRYGRFEANFSITNTNLQLVILQKPLVIPSTMVKTKLAAFFSNYNLDDVASIFNERRVLA